MNALSSVHQEGESRIKFSLVIVRAPLKIPSLQSHGIGSPHGRRVGRHRGEYGGIAGALAKAECSWPQAVAVTPPPPEGGAHFAV